jgi:hypothetical protein
MNSAYVFVKSAVFIKDENQQNVYLKYLPTALHVLQMVSLLITDSCFNWYCKVTY